MPNRFCGYYQAIPNRFAAIVAGVYFNGIITNVVILITRASEWRTVNNIRGEYFCNRCITLDFDYTGASAH